MSRYVLAFGDIDKTKIMLVGGKGANLGELARVEGICVPDGFCITTVAFERIIAEMSPLNALLYRLSLLKVQESDKIAALSAEIRALIEGVTIPQEMQDEIVHYLSRLGEKDAYAIRSSATVEDLPTASFAGQQDTYLNIIGQEAMLTHVRKCWASLFSERAVTYRLQNGFDHREVLLAVVVQRMVFPQVAGIMFTADPVTSNRKVVSIDASFGLGEALVSGLVNADVYKVRDGEIIEKRISSKKQAVYALKDGGTQEQGIEPERQNKQALTDEQIVRLERIGRQIEAHFARPQDIEWCLLDNAFAIVQSRPITTLYPIPQASDQHYHVYLSVGHQQMMTDAMKPLGLSIHQLVAARPMFEAGDRLFVDITAQLASPVSQAMLVNAMGQHDPFTKDAVMTIIERGDFVQALPDDMQEQLSGKSNTAMSPASVQVPFENDANIVSRLMKRSQSSIEALKQHMQMKAGAEVFDFILQDMQELKKILFDPQSSAVFMAAINASLWINANMEQWLGEKNAADTLSQSVPHNITSEMGLALLDVADVMRPYPEVIAFLQEAKDDTFLHELPKFPGGQESRDALSAFLDMYGMRCVGEIDITRPRWSEQPTALIPVILSNIKNFEPGMSVRKFEQGRQEALDKERELVDRLGQLADGEQKVRETRRMINIMRNFIGYREYPKYGMVSRYFVYKQALLKEAERLVQAGVIRQQEDVYYLTFEEFGAVVRTQTLDEQVISRRKEEYARYEKLTPPRVITSDGEIVAGKYKREHMPAKALAGLAVSAGVVEGRARIILNMQDADVEEGDIVVTAFTDPSWTPLFVSIKGLVTEVGGLMTHGAVIAREYGLPAVVGVEDATRLIKDRQRIRVNGTEGYVEIL